jgi:hypothetical protein
LEVLVSLNDALENFNHSLDTIPFALGFEEVDRRSFIVEIRSSWLEKTTDKEDFKELFIVPEEFEGGTSLNKFGNEGFGSRRGRDEGEVDKKRVSEGYLSVSFPTYVHGTHPLAQTWRRLELVAFSA